jgi:2'-5' RNA ligase
MASSNSDARGTLPPALRLFFALWPEDSQRAALRSLVDSLQPPLSGRPVPWANLHVTLAFLGNVDPGRIGALRSLAAGQAWPTLDLVFDRLATWPKARLWCLEATNLPPVFAAAVDAFHDSLRAAGFPFERRPFRAHITLARNLPLPLAATSRPVPPFHWPVRRVELVESTPTGGGAVYRLVTRA